MGPLIGWGTEGRLGGGATQVKMALGRPAGQMQGFVFNLRADVDLHPNQKPVEGPRRSRTALGRPAGQMQRACSGGSFLQGRRCVPSRKTRVLCLLPGPQHQKPCQHAPAAQRAVHMQRCQKLCRAGWVTRVLRMDPSCPYRAIRGGRWPHFWGLHLQGSQACGT